MSDLFDFQTQVHEPYVRKMTRATAYTWWIEREDGERIAGPFTTETDANRARVWVEKAMCGETFWIRELGVNP